MSDKNRVVVRIYKQEYTMAGNETKEYMLKVANYVDEKMTHIAEKNKKLSTTMIAVLTALNVADEYLKLKNQLEEKEKESEKSLKELEETRIRLEQLEEAAMEPLQELEKTRSQLATVNQEFKMRENTYKETIENLKKENKNFLDGSENIEQMIEEIKQLKEELSLRDTELEEIENANDDLQKKLLDSQNKYNQVKKELEAFIETFDEEKGI
jgi:cell division protein ZapA